MDGRRRERLWRLLSERAPGGSGWAGVVVALVVAELGVEGAAITVRTASRVQDLAAASDDWTAALEELQYTVGEGPGVEAFETGGPVLVEDLRADHDRWPGLTDSALPSGVAAAFAFPMQAGAIRLGTLSLYRRQTGELSADELADALVLADLATTALLTDSSGAEPASAEAHEGYYDDVNVATGMLATELRVSLEDALLRLRAHAFSNHLPLTEVARAIVLRQLRLDAPPD
ncbi:GAF and ANTAR domain-containing protein [Amycolatopsis solani]|uniref:GAF and ANTAR domain-containing protein n=1 Tax=Amycolatopsis solani TaxID=3028615 RepID=UPI00296FAFDB|nr:GAF and ANTAR domain-containing protein [Amycolatopsis sp. MEP2-6]